MPFQIIVVLVGILIGWIRKGNLWSIVNARLRQLWILPTAYILQYVSMNYLHQIYYDVGIVASCIGILVFCLLNMDTPGLKWALAGTASNFLAMLANGLRMPVYLPLVEKLAPNMVPLLNTARTGKHIAMSTHTHLNYLGDIFLVNLPSPSLVSIGDILFAIGLIIFMQHAMRDVEHEIKA